MTRQTRPASAIRRLDLGYFVRPATETGGPKPRVEPALAYLVRRPEGLLLFDTGLGEGDPGTDAHYRPVRRPLRTALAAAGVAPDDIDLVVNCHLHFDHCGGNPLLAGVPVLVQAAELAAARAGDYTIDALVDFPGARYRELAGETEVWPGVRVVPTPGHTAGHQSLVVTDDRGDGGNGGSGGAVVLAGQAYDFASEYGSAVLARRAAREGVVGAPLPPYPAWLDRLAEFAPRRVLFAHDHAVWEPSEASAP
ncbi:N-acyl homoserine lactonase family protein [Kitasatospora sp. NPDC093806]|uniref:N-acyl homoserine lactonase family protein n=1 Tax=Kitasatospora sp. NPDC093806 TaxID=3155075 RepID=UPI00343A39FB